MAIICSRCHCENPGEMRYCGQCASPLRGSLPPVSWSPPQGERRQLTVLFCDLVGSTELSQRLDPEDLNAVLRAYHDAAGGEIRALDGHIAQYLGDGLLVYFGYPVAYEDSAVRAVRASLRVIDAIREVNPRVQASFGADLRVRIGIHTGLVLVSDVGAEQRHERLAVGETPNLAARVQGQAAVDQVVVSEATWRLVSAHFQGRALGAAALKGISQPVALYEVVGELDADRRLGTRAATALTPLLGHDEIIEQLRQRWAAALQGHAAVALLSGEPGIGKSRHVRALKDLVARDDATVLEASCEAGGEGTALRPLIDLLRRSVAAPHRADPDALMDALRASLARADVDRDDAVALLASLLSIAPEGRYALAPRAPQKQRADTFAALRAWLLAAPSPTLLVIEDLHWADPSTVEFLQLVIDAAPHAKLMVALTARPSFKAPWGASGAVAEIPIQRLHRDDAARLIDGVTRGRAMPADLRERIIERADGVPLFIEEVTRSVMESDRVRVTADRIELLGASTYDVVPASVQDSLLARLDRLGAGRTLAQLAATVGREFSYPMLRDLGMFDEEGLRRELEGLVSAGIVTRDPDEEGRYAFRHVLFRDTAYQSLLRATRQRYHHAILRVLTDRSPDIASQRPELLAQHYAGAGLLGEAIEHWRMAGQSTAAKSALRESEANYRRALEQVETLAPSPERDRSEVSLRTGLGLALIQTQGFATRDIELNYARASELCARATEVPFPVLIGVWTVVFVRGDRAGVDRVEPQMRKVAETATDPTIRLVARSSLASAAFYGNRLREAVAHGDLAVEALEGRDPREVLPALLAYGSEALLYGHLYRALAEAAMGRRENALRGLAEARAIAEATALPYMLALVHGFGGGIAAALEAPEMARECGHKALELARQNGLMFWVAASQAALGWARAKLGDPTGGVEEIRGAIALIRAIGATVVIPMYFGFLAEALLLAGDFEAGLAAADEGLAFARSSLAGDRPPAESLWLRGALLAKLGRRDEAAAALREAIAVATASEAGPALAHAEAHLRGLEVAT